MLEFIANHIQALENSTHIHWIPAHTDKLGNEAAGVAAKEATW